MMGLQEEMMKQVGHKEQGKCMCFGCSVQAIRTDDELMTEHVRTMFGGLIQSFMRWSEADKYMTDPIHLAGICHGVLLILDAVAMPVYITKDPDLLRSAIFHMMQTSAKQTLKENPEKVRQILEEVVKKKRSEL